jgi:abortive infection bacteriophage resistance protein
MNSPTRIDKLTDSSNNKVIAVATPLLEVHQGGSFCFNDFLTPQQHVLLLKERGLLFRDIYEEDRFIKLIQSVGYYPLSQYFKHFYQPNSKLFKPNTQAKSIITTYRQNERLRLLLIASLLKLETKFRTLLTEQMIATTTDIYWCYNSAFENLGLITTATRKQQGNYTEQATRLFVQQYPEHTQLPAWVVMQPQNFGTLCELLKHSKTPRKIWLPIIKELNFPKKYTPKTLYPVFNALRYLRNICVHQGKLLGENLRISPPLWIDIPAQDAQKISNTIAWVQHLLQSVTERGSFNTELREIQKTLQQFCPSSCWLSNEQALQT